MQDFFSVQKLPRCEAHHSQTVSFSKVMAFNQFAALDDFENCIWNNEFPSDQILDRMMALTFSQEVCIYLFHILICNE